MGVGHLSLVCVLVGTWPLGILEEVLGGALSKTFLGVLLLWLWWLLGHQRWLWHRWQL